MTRTAVFSGMRAGKSRALTRKGPHRARPKASSKSINATVSKHAKAWIQAHCCAWQFAGKVAKRIPDESQESGFRTITQEEDLFHGCFDGIGFRKGQGAPLYIQWTTQGAVSARKLKVHAQFIRRFRGADPAWLKAHLGRVYVWGYVPRKGFETHRWDWDDWAWKPASFVVPPDFEKTQAKRARKKAEKSASGQMAFD